MAPGSTDFSTDSAAYSFVEPVTPRIQRVVSTAATTPATPIVVSPDVLQAQFVAFGVAEESFETDKLEETYFNALKTEFGRLDLAAQRTIVAQILEINAKSGKRKDLVKAINEAPDNFQVDRPLWRDLSLLCAAISTDLLALQAIYAPYAKTGSVFSEVLKNRKNDIEGLQKTADVNKQKDPTQSAGDINQYDEMMFAQARRDNSRKVPRVDIERVRKAEAFRQDNMRRIKMAPFIGPFPELPKSWRAVDYLHGGMGTIVVYVLDDGKGRIEDRVVVKDSMTLAWDKEDTWYGEGTNKVPIEYWCHQALLDTGTDHVIGLKKREVHVDDRLEVQKYRMFLEYAPHGDLGNLLDRHMDADVPIPEPFILYVFKALIDSCLAMQRGKASPTLDKSWQQIVHRDLKPGNVFLGERSSTSFPAYPNPKLADFGLAMVTYPDDEANPALYNMRAGTAGFLPPEQLSFVHPTTEKPVDDFKILSPCNVWGVGAIMLCLLENRKISSTEQPSYLPNGKWCYTVNAEATKKFGYSEDLCAIVDSCLRYEPDARPTLEQLEKRIAQKIAANPWLANQSNKSAEKTVAAPQNSSIVEKVHKHHLGMALRELFPGDVPASAVGGADWSNMMMEGAPSSVRRFLAYSNDGRVFRT